VARQIYSEGTSLGAMIGTIAAFEDSLNGWCTIFLLVQAVHIYIPSSFGADFDDTPTIVRFRSLSSMGFCADTPSVFILSISGSKSCCYFSIFLAHYNHLARFGYTFSSCHSNWSANLAILRFLVLLLPPSYISDFLLLVRRWNNPLVTMTYVFTL